MPTKAMAGEFLAQRRERRRRSGIARDHDRVATALQEEAGDAAREAANFVRGARSVRDVRLVGAIDRRLVWELPRDFAPDRQAADPGIETADESHVHHLRRVRGARL
jgi:hypothetical protein